MMPEDSFLERFCYNLSVNQKIVQNNSQALHSWRNKLSWTSNTKWLFLIFLDNVRHDTTNEQFDEQLDTQKKGTFQFVELLANGLI